MKTLWQNGSHYEQFPLLPNVFKSRTAIEASESVCMWEGLISSLDSKCQQTFLRANLDIAPILTEMAIHSLIGIDVLIVNRLVVVFTSHHRT